VGDWTVIRLGDACTKIGSGATPRGGKEAYLDEGRFTLVRSQNILHNQFSKTGLAFISDEAAEKLKTVTLEPNDLLLNITGDSVARACKLDASVLPARVNQHVAILRPDPEKLDHGFLRYWLIHPSTVSMMLQLASAGATRNALTKGMIEGFEVNAPSDIDEQRAIASILSAFDDKIELNRRTAETLEAMARAVFKSWFVDFDPVRAKAGGREPEWMDAETAAQFPERFGVDGVPEGWTWSELGNALAVLETGTRPKGGIKGIDDGVPSVGAESINGLAVFDFNKTKYVPFDFFEKANRGKVESRDVLLYKDGGKPGEFRPKVGLYGDGFPYDQFAINEHVFRLRVSPPFGQNFLYFWMTTDALLHEMHVKGTGVAVPGINQPAVRSLSLIRANSVILGGFETWSDPLVTRCLSLANESRQLAVVRDTLLPRLLSGEIRVGDAERVAEGIL
jgi:type I restriction enzyme S subunit